MAETMKPSSAPFTTSMIIPEANEYLQAAWARAFANNTGWLTRQYRVLCHLGTTTGCEGRFYFEAGTYDIRAYAGVGAQTVTIDGSTIISAATGEGTMFDWATAGGWMAVHTDATGGEYASIAWRYHCN